MSNWQGGLLLLVLLQRLVELGIARQNANWMKKQGGYEVGENHYPWLILIHLLFFIGILLEAQIPPTWWIVPFLLFILAQVLRVWSISSLGPYWNTRIWVIPHHSPIARGPYRWIRHPNYLVVCVELLMLPLLYQAYLTAGFITILNAFVLFFIRIPAEEQAWREVTEGKAFLNSKRMFRRLKKN